MKMTCNGEVVEAVSDWTFGTTGNDETSTLLRDGVPVGMIKSRKIAAEIVKLLNGPIVWAEEATPLTGLEVKALLEENEKFRGIINSSGINLNQYCSFCERSYQTLPGTENTDCPYCTLVDLCGGVPW